MQQQKGQKMEPVNVHQEYRVQVFLHYLPDNSIREKDKRLPYSAMAWRLHDSDATIGWGKTPQEAVLDAMGITENG